MAPKVVIVLPCYKEPPEILLRTVDSLVDCDYPQACLHIFLSFDGDQEDQLYLNTIGRLGVPMVRTSGYPTSIDVTYRGCRVTISRFPHGGKRHCQKRTFKLIDKVYTEYLKVNDNLFVLFIDSDCILDKVIMLTLFSEARAHSISGVHTELHVRDGAQARQQSNHASYDWCHHINDGEEHPDHSPAGYGIHPRSTVRESRRVWLWCSNMSAWSLNHLAIFSLSQACQVLLC